jgi:hypothetical protein
MYKNQKLLWAKLDANGRLRLARKEAVGAYVYWLWIITKTSVRILCFRAEN